MRIGNRILSTGQPYTLIQFGILYNHLLSVGLTQSFKTLAGTGIPNERGISLNVRAPRVGSDKSGKSQPIAHPSLGCVS